MLFAAVHLHFFDGTPVLADAPDVLIRSSFEDRVRALRVRTGASLNAMKSALAQTNGDFEKAAALLLGRGLA